MSYEREAEIPFDILRLDDFTYLVPHGIRIETEILVRAGVVKMSLVNRNVTVGPAQHDEPVETLGYHPLFPVDEFLTVKSVDPILTRYSQKLLELLGITIETIYEHFFEANQKMLDIDPSQLSISKGRLIFGEIVGEQMNIVWTGKSFVAAPASAKLLPPEETVMEIEGSIVGGQFRCKYGMLEIIHR